MGHGLKDSDFEDELQERAAILEFDGGLNRHDAEEQAWGHTEASSPVNAVTFPPQAIVGSVGDLARVLGQGTEVPEEFHFFAGLTLLGNHVATKLKLRVGLNIAPRLYTVILGDSNIKKSTAVHKNKAIFDEIGEELYGDDGDAADEEIVIEPVRPFVSYGVGSGEGLTKLLQERPQLCLAYDELRTLIDKTNVQNSTLLPAITSLFESTNWDNVTTRGNHSVRDAHLSLVGCCTPATYEAMWTSAAISIGLLNRLFVISAEPKPKVAWPREPDPLMLDACKKRITQQIKRLPLTWEISEEGHRAWNDYYHSLPVSEHAKRLDTIGLRLLALVALITDREGVDLCTVETVTSMLDYELRIRQLTDPVDCDNKIARLEEGVRRVLATLTPRTKRELRRTLHADRYGLWMLDRALTNLIGAGDVRTVKLGKTVRYALAKE